VGTQYTGRRELLMAKIISLMHLSFDGFAATSEGKMDWITYDQKISEYVSKFISRVGTGIYGPKTYQMMESYWPGVLKNAQSGELEQKHATWYQSAKKIVCSQTLTSLENKETQLVSMNLKVTFEKLKETAVKDLMVFGSPRLTQSLARLDLFDEYVINVNPVLLGGGIRMFEDLPRTKLELVSVTPFESGVVGFHYKRQR
jgi:dihydrofolate reductase